MREERRLREEATPESVRKIPSLLHCRVELMRSVLVTELGASLGLTEEIHSEAIIRTMRVTRCSF